MAVSLSVSKGLLSYPIVVAKASTINIRQVIKKTNQTKITKKRYTRVDSLKLLLELLLQKRCPL